METASRQPHFVRRAAPAVLARPSLWLVAVRQAWRLAPRGWWRRRPWLPVPDAAYLRFRIQTMYGNPAHDPEPADVVAWLRWCRTFPGR
ncbi:MAG: hypothetical protein ACRD0U_08175 [Acidimicrobiales bacterium]